MRTAITAARRLLLLAGVLGAVGCSIYDPMWYQARIVLAVQVESIENVKIDAIEYGTVMFDSPTEYHKLPYGSHTVTIGADDTAIGELTPAGGLPRRFTVTILGPLDAVTIDVRED